nr:MAG TPA: hypothetical protein [Caudoviricetes sp.]
MQGTARRLANETPQRHAALGATALRGYCEVLRGRRIEYYGTAEISTR